MLSAVKIFDDFPDAVKRRSGKRLSHEEVVDQLDEQTVFYDVDHASGKTSLASETLV